MAKGVGGWGCARACILRCFGTVLGTQEHTKGSRPALATAPSNTLMYDTTTSIHAGLQGAVLLRSTLLRPMQSLFFPPFCFILRRGRGKIKPKLTTLPRIFIRVRKFNPFGISQSSAGWRILQFPWWRTARAGPSHVQRQNKVHTRPHPGASMQHTAVQAVVRVTLQAPALELDTKTPRHPIHNK